MKDKKIQVKGLTFNNMKAILRMHGLAHKQQLKFIILDAQRRLRRMGD